MAWDYRDMHRPRETCMHRLWEPSVPAAMHCRSLVLTSSTNTINSAALRTCAHDDVGVCTCLPTTRVKVWQQNQVTVTDRRSHSLIRRWYSLRNHQNYQMETITCGSSRLSPCLHIVHGLAIHHWQCVRVVGYCHNYSYGAEREGYSTFTIVFWLLKL